MDHIHDLAGLTNGDELQLSHEARMLLTFARKGGRHPKDLTKQDMVNAFHRVFEMIGGVPRFALWADKNPGDFYAHYAKMLPQQLKHSLELPPAGAPVAQTHTPTLRAELDAAILAIREAQTADIISITPYDRVRDDVTQQGGDDVPPRE